MDGFVRAHWQAPAGVQAFTTTRLGPGVSLPPFDAFNLGDHVGDDAAAVAANRVVGTVPFERFQVGGDGINNQQFGFQGVDIISMSGYEVSDLAANFDAAGRTSPAAIFDKFTIEMRYPLSLNPSSTIYVLAIAQGANAWRNLRDFNPFDLKRSAGFGMRVFLPMFGMPGFDYGIGFDKQRLPGQTGLKGLGDFNIILGFEPE